MSDTSFTESGDQEGVTQGSRFNSESNSIEQPLDSVSKRTDVEHLAEDEQVEADDGLLG